MFGRLFIYQLKMILRTKWIVGWNFLFPIVLATAFFLGFGNMLTDDPDSFSVLQVGYVDESQMDSPGFKSVIEDLAKKTKYHEQILEITYFDSYNQAEEALDEEEIDGFYLETADDVEIYVASNGLASTSLTQVVKEYQNYLITINNVATDHLENIDAATKVIASNIAPITKHDFGSGVSQHMQYFYALIAMTSLFGSWISTAMLSSICANISEVGKRFECAPGHKLMAVVTGILAGTLLQACSNAVVIIYIEYVLGLTFGTSVLNIIWVSAVGSALGIAIGILIGSLVTNHILLSMIPLTVSMVCSFFSGLMFGAMQQIIQYHAPILNKINPASVFTDCLYVVSNYGKTKDYYTDILIMTIMIATCLIISAFSLRRRNYDYL